ncbi:Leishmanolysin [Roseovarius pacificus]|uniref:Leishmanolysin n=1 Tax=Roseovarius pacificus TaxID=337701 RepID=A0A1M7HQ90_9RHOB|nr:leishmanolysin-related zinc metalloendopeptidase [Roseovarius pacificus]GGO60542.1 hypothetical protein GCM10011315_35210 [Roseovarius pacificus]SHM30732.1 Leishmanolysin [Roseovarius pacificus]
MKRDDLFGQNGPLADVLPPEFDSDTVETFFARGEGPQPDRAGPPEHAAVWRHGGEDVPEIPDLESLFPDAAQHALEGLMRAAENAATDLDERARPLKEFAAEDDDDHDHDDQIVDAEAKPVWAGGGKNSTDDGGTSGSKGKGNGKNKDKTDSGDTTDGGDTGGTDGGDTGGTDTGETNTGSDNPDVYVSGLDTPDGFNIELLFDGLWTDAQKAALANAAEAISDFITGDLPSHNGIDDIRITVTKAAIDGDGGAWATGGPRSLRSDSYLPSTGVLTFDEADVDALDSKGLWEDLATHEMMHALGFGTLFSTLGLVEQIDGQMRFTGANAIEAYNSEFADIASGDSLSDQGVQLDSSGAHWHDGTFTKELLTPYLRYSGNYMSEMSIAAMEDIGYETTYDMVTIA